MLYIYLKITIVSHKMIIVDNVLVSEDILSVAFACNLISCRGACCVEGESGAPLDKEETLILDKLYPKIKKYLNEKGIKAIEQQGRHIVDSDGDYVTPLVGGRECAYTVFENNIAFCGIEKAYKDGAVDFQKPISCHLYPIRVSKNKYYEKLNYHKWKICSAACKTGEEKQIRIYEFLKKPLIKKYGKKWYSELDKIAKEFISQKKK